MNCLLTPATKYCCIVWFSSVVSKSAKRTHSDSGGHESWLQEWSTPLNGAVLGVQRHSKASDAMMEHYRDPLAQRGRMSGLAPGARHAADGPAKDPPARRSAACETAGAPLADEAGRHESGTLCAISHERSRLCGPPHWATNPRTGGRPA